jgi:hypothetical protein
VLKAQSLKGVGFGKGTDLVWSSEGLCAVSLPGNNIQVYNCSPFEAQNSLTCEAKVEELFGGPLLGLKCADFLLFYNW